jgi:dihydrofolate reductase
MRELTYYVAVSLDGFIAGPEGQFDAFPAEGDHMAAITEQFPDTLPTDLASSLGIDQSRGRFGTVLMGWNTYAVGLGVGVTSPYRHLEQIVFTRSHLHEELGPRPNLRVTDEHPVAVVRALKAERSPAPAAAPSASSPAGEPAHDGIWLCGGGELASVLVEQIDRLVLKRSPVLLGAGIPLFAHGAYEPTRFDEVSTTAFASGVVISEYVRRRDG